MELGAQIKRLRKEHGWNQEELAEKAYVSRQTVSNWENEKSYPDVHSLLILSVLFGVTLDELVKGDVEVMKKEIKQDSINEFRRWSNIYNVLFIITIISPFPMAKLLGWVGFALWAVIMSVSLAVAFKVEHIKKQNDIQTFKEIVAFMDGKTLDDLEKVREEAKRPYQKALLAAATSVLTGIILLALHYIFT